MADRPKLGFVELLTRIGDANIYFQNLDQCMVRANSVLKGKAVDITFRTDSVSAIDMVNGDDDRIGLICWVKRSDVQAAKDAFAKSVADKEPAK